jgi:hypothetical protein
MNRAFDPIVAAMLVLTCASLAGCFTDTASSDRSAAEIESKAQSAESADSQAYKNCVMGAAGSYAIDPK